LQLNISCEETYSERLEGVFGDNGLVAVEGSISSESLNLKMQTFVNFLKIFQQTKICLYIVKARFGLGLHLLYPQYNNIDMQKRCFRATVMRPRRPLTRVPTTLGFLNGQGGLKQLSTIGVHLVNPEAIDQINCLECC